MKASLAGLLCLCMLWACACEQQAATAPNNPTKDPKTARIMKLVGPKPATWIEQAPGGMVGRVANYTLPGIDGAVAARLFAHSLGPAGAGTPQNNIEIWTASFRSPTGGPVVPTVDRFKVSGMHVTLVELAGEFKKTGGPGINTDQVFMCAIVEAPSGPIYIRIFGQTATIERNREAYMELIRGLRPREEP